MFGVPPPQEEARRHQDKIQKRGAEREEFFAMVHKKIELPQAMKIKDARDAREAEWKKLEAWDITK